ncbi:GNAT family N-acetyltransferase [Muriicola soli]|uniref:N-acetyltransferase n=1 Tax=Muriicola soli TaxID=2507538 RepID=A0A411E8X5_9FLAO|nr:GNAT family N-acetyltransferase [Muriicola soli]QBA63984.1 N-acetyltransferase [Muriicola soli]
MYTTIETERLRLRPINLKDVDFIFELVNSKGWLEFIGDRNVSDKKDAENYIKRILANENYFYTIFELKNTLKAIGIITLLNREEEEFPDIGFALLPYFESNGYAFEASRYYLDKIKNLNTYDNIIAITIPDNVKSIRLLEKLGLHYMGNYKKGEEILSYYSLKNVKPATKNL